ncbi:MAG: hypothetical protein J6K25_04105 [Thermoguttaceae bacterium]|nr:hypothetical protein [Thermoguttaceae bacterium]
MGKKNGVKRAFFEVKTAKIKKMKIFEFCPLTIREDRLKSLLSVGDNETQAELSFFKRQG